MYRGIKSGTLSYEIQFEHCPMFVLLLGPVWYVSWSSGGLPAIWSFRAKSQAVTVCLRFGRFAPNHKQRRSACDVVVSSQITSSDGLLAIWSFRAKSQARVRRILSVCTQLLLTLGFV